MEERIVRTRNTEGQTKLILQCQCGAQTTISEGEYVTCSRCGRNVRFAWGIKRHQFSEMWSLTEKVHGEIPINGN